MSSIPQFYFSKKSMHTKKDTQSSAIMNMVTELYQSKESLAETEFLAVTAICSLPTYMNLALIRAIDAVSERITLDQFKKSWPLLSQHCDDIDIFIYDILKKPELDCITPDDFLPVLEDIVLNHPALQFLENNIVFQERYIETVICRIFYDAQCPTGKLSLKQFRKSGFPSIIRALDSYVDLYIIHNIFSYKQFYVLYCKLWVLDIDHDLTLSEMDLCNYNMGTLTRLTVSRVMQKGHILAFYDPEAVKEDLSRFTSLSVFDFIWFLLSEVDKSTPMAIEYWFRCLDIDEDGILSTYELEQFWKDQDSKQRFGREFQTDCFIRFQDIIRQLNDLIQPQIPGQFTLKDLKKNGYLAERFFDTFINYDRFQVHDIHQEGSIREKKIYEQKQRLQESLPCKPLVLTDDLGFPMLSNWDDYADVEYNQILVDENYNNYRTSNVYENDQVTTDSCSIEKIKNANEELTVLKTSSFQIDYQCLQCDDNIVIEQVANAAYIDFDYLISFDQYNESKEDNTASVESIETYETGTLAVSTAKDCDDYHNISEKDKIQSYNENEFDFLGDATCTNSPNSLTQSELILSEEEHKLIIVSSMINNEYFDLKKDTLKTLPHISSYS